MQLSEEKLAQIAAGAAPESVLTAEELAEYKKTLEDKGAESQEGAEGTSEEESDESGNDAEASQGGSGDADLLKEIGRLEARLELSQEAHEALKGQLVAAQETETALLGVAQAAISNLQTALGLPKEQKATAKEVLAQYEALQGQMAAKFPTQRQTKTPTEDTTALQHLSFRTAQAPAQSTNK